MLGVRMWAKPWIGLIAFIALSGTACDDTTSVDDRAVFELEVTGERFRIALTDPVQIARAEALLQSGAEQNVHGTLKRGDGGFNAPYGWHLDPSTVTFPDLTMEVCDGRPNSDVQSDISYWVDTIKYYCPWGARVVGKN